MSISFALDPERVAKLEAHAARNPAAYRWKVALLSLFGDVALTTALILPIALPIGIGLLFFQNELLLWLGGIALVFLIWLVRPRAHFSARNIEPNEAPELFAAIGELQRKLGVEGRIDIAVDKNFNAGAIERRGFLGLLGNKRTLVLGVPLLSALTRDQVLAVVAHEFGHFSRRHGLLGHWLYRARSGWLHYAAHTDDHDSAFEKGAVSFAEWFVPMFSGYSFVHARQCEYEADADAASAVSASAFADALTQVHVKGRAWVDNLDTLVPQWQRENDSPPQDAHARWTQALRGAPAESMQRYLETAIAERSDLLDSHPCLTDRLAALKQSAGLGAVVGMSAGESLFGDKWAQLVEEFDREWQDEARAGWRFRHFYFAHLVRPLLESNAGKESHSVDERIVRAARLVPHKEEEGLAELREIQADHPGNAQACFELGAALLSSNEPQGIKLMREAMRIDSSYEPAVFRVLVLHARSSRKHAEAEKYANSLQRASRKQALAADKMMMAVDEGKFQAPELDESVRAVLRESMAGSDAVVQGWVAFRQVEQQPLNAADDSSPTPYACYCVILQVDPEKGGLTSQEICTRFAEEMHDMVAPNAIVLSVVTFTTETMLPALQAALDANPECRCFPRG
jgi:Zn-dependent protease with chaperone function